VNVEGARGGERLCRHLPNAKLAQSLQNKVMHSTRAAGHCSVTPSLPFLPFNGNFRAALADNIVVDIV